MTENRYNDFDLEIRNLLQAEEEEVPQQLWEAVNARVQHRRREGAWLKWAGAAVAAAAAFAAVLTLVRPSIPSNTPSELIAENTVMPNGEKTSEIAEELPIDGNSVLETTRSFSSPAPTSPGKQILKEESTAKTSDGTVSESENDVEAMPGQSEKETPAAKEPAKRNNVTEKKTTAGTPDPFAMMAYEDLHKKTGRLEFDVKGLVGTNDNSATGTGSGMMAANGTKSPTATAAIAEDSESIYGVPVTVGAGVKMHFAPRWAVSAGLDYTLLWRSFKGTYTSPDSRQFYSDNIKHSVQYIGLPVNLYFDIISAEYVSMYAFAGGALEKGIEDKYVIPASAGVQTWKQNVPGFQWSAAAGLGVQFRIWEHMGLFADPGMRYFFDCNQPKSIRTQQPLMFSMELGLRFDL